MIGLLIAIFACIYFFIEAKKRGQPPYKWLFVAFISFLGPKIVISWILLPIVLVALEIPLEKSQGTLVSFALLGFGIGFYLLIVARKKLYRNPRIVQDEGIVVVKSVGIVENNDGTFTVGVRLFSARTYCRPICSIFKGNNVMKSNKQINYTPTA